MKLGELWRRLVSIARRSKLDRELEEEMRLHVELRERKYQESGLSGKHARFAARRQFGNSLGLRERSRELWAFRWLDELAQDMRFGARLLVHSPLFTTIVVLSLALGIGANAAIFSVVDALMLRRLPVAAPDELVIASIRSGDRGTHYSWSYPLYQQFRDHADALAGVICIAGGGKTRASFNSGTTAAQPEFVERQDVSGNYWSVLGVPALIGRTFTQQDDRLGNSHEVAVISYGFWESRFNLDPQVIGRSFILYNTPFTIIGVAPPNFRGTRPDVQPQIWIPITTRQHLFSETSNFTEHGRGWLTLIARLRPGATLAQAKAQVDALYQVDHREQLKQWGSQLTSQQLAEEQTRHVELESGATGFSWNRERYSRSLYVLLIIAGLVLLIACVNVANLLLARAAARRREIAVRLSIGAGRWRLCRQLLTESVLLSVVAGALSVALAVWGSRTLVAFASGDDPLKLNLSPDWRIFVFVIGLSILTGILFGVAPALRSTHMDVSPVLKPASGTFAAGKLGLRLDKSLIVAQVALALLLIVTAGLFIRTLEKLRNIDTGFDRDHVLLFSLDLGPAYDNLPMRWGLYQRILSELQRLPGTVAASFSMIPYLSHSAWTDNLVPEGYVRRKEEDVECWGVPVGPEFTRAAGLRLLAGRDFGPQDQLPHPPDKPKPGVAPQLPPVVIVSQSLARYYFGLRDPLGRYLHLDYQAPDAPKGHMRIIGVVNDTSYRSLRDPKPRAFYIPYFQTLGYFGDDPTFFVRTYGSPDAISATVQRLVSKIDPRVQATEIQTMRHMIDNDTLQERVLASLSAFLSGFALLLVSLGLYGVTAYSVTSRTGEIGIRMALGAQSGNVLRMVLREIAVLVVIGAAIGVPITLLLAELLRSQLFGIGPHDPAALITAMGAMLAVALAAAWIPAHRAARIDPMVALRYE